MHYTHHPIFYAFTRLFGISSSVTKDKVVQRIRLLGSKEVYQMYNDIHSFADKLVRFLDFKNTVSPWREQIAKSLCLLINYRCQLQIKFHTPTAIKQNNVFKLNKKPTARHARQSNTLCQLITCCEEAANPLRYVENDKSIWNLYLTWLS